MAYDRPCLYCRDTERIRTEEHVLQQAFDTTFVLAEDVCDHCNTQSFSRLDTELVSYVRFLARANHPAISNNRDLLQRGHSISLDPITGAWFSVRRLKQGGIVPLRQVAVLGNGRYVSIPDQDIVSTLRQDLLDPTSLRLDVVIAGAKQEAHPSIIWSRPKCWAVRASKSEAAEELRRRILQGTLFEPTAAIETSADTFAGRAVEINLEFVTNNAYIQRALAKSALNLVCAIAGPTVARLGVLEPLRQFILGAGDGTGFVQLDPYDQAPPEVRDAARSFCRDGHHTMLLAEAAGRPTVVISLYEEPFAIVRLTSDTSVEPILDGRTTACLFNYRERTHRVLSSHDGTLYEEFDRTAPKTGSSPLQTG